MAGGPGVIDLSTESISRPQPAGGWGLHRIWIAVALGATLAGSRRILNFWSLGAAHSPSLGLRDLLQNLAVFFILPLAVVAIVVFLIAAAISLWRRHFRRAASSIFAIAAIPICFLVIANVSLFDPWLWYTISNNSRFEALAARDPSPNGQKYAKIEVRDVSVGLVGNHFIALFYDESDALGLDPSERPSIWRTRTWYGSPIPQGRRLYGHVFIVDIFE
jgi:hypothetical protein